MPSIRITGSTRSSTAPLVAWALAAIVAGVGGPLLLAGELRRDEPVSAALSLALLVLPVCGALVVNQRPRNTLGWVLLISGAAQVFAASIEDGRLKAIGPGEGSPVVAWLTDLMWPLVLPLLFAFGLLLFPDGLPSPRWRPFAIAGSVGVLAMMVGSGFAPWSATTHGGMDHPFVSSPSIIPQAASLAGQTLLLGVACGGIAAGASRYRRGDPLIRAQLQLMLVFAAIAVAWFAALAVASQLTEIPKVVDEISPLIVVVGFPVAITIALWRHRLFDLDLIVNRTAIALVVALILGTGYAVVVAGLSWQLSSRAEWLPSWLGAIAMALAFQPVLSRVKAAMSHRLFGETPDSRELLTQFEEQTQGLADPQAMAVDLAQAAMASVRSPHAFVRLADGTTASAGRARLLPMHHLTLVSQSEQIGTLSVCTRSATDQFTETELELLRSLARHSATAIRLVRLARELGHAHERTAAQVSEARKRLRRDLHDELGPRLTGVSYLLHALRPALQDDEVTLLHQAETELRDAISDVRRMAHDLRPEVLEDLGLVDAIRRHVAQLTMGSRLVISVESGTLPTMPAKVETALYRVALEALSNVGRHSEADHCWVSLGVDGEEASLEVRDDGLGIRADITHGMGLSSINRRVSELGGACEISSNPGTTVRVRVPLHV